MRRVLPLLLVLGLVPPALADDLARTFAKPMPEFSPVPIWWWSGDKVERDRLREQLEHIAAGGIHNAIVLNLAPSGPLYGSAADDPPFLTEAWWDLFGYALGEAKRVGVRMWFYDQLGFSGSGLQARVVRDHPEFRGLELRRVVKDVTGPAEAELAVPPDGTALAAYLAEKVTSAGNAPNWIWDGSALDAAGKRYFRRTFELKAAPENADLRITCDNGFVLYVNDTEVGKAGGIDTEVWKQVKRYDVAKHLRAGKNVIAVEGENLAPGPAGLLLSLSTPGEKGQEPIAVVLSDATFKLSATATDGWTAGDFDDSRWASTHVIGPPPAAPWGPMAGIGGDDSFLGERTRNVTIVTDKLNAGRLRVSVPKGPHRLQIFYTVPGGFDYHNPAAGAALIDVVHGQMEKRFGKELGKGIAGSFQDEFPPMPRWSARMLEQFKKRCGYDLTPYLPALYDDIDGDRETDPTTIQVRCNANRLAAELCEEAFFKPLYDWHERHGLLCGYDQTVRNADPAGGEGYYVDYFKTMRHYSVPGNDQSGDAKPHESIADLYERPRVWLEGFHSSGWGQTPEEIITLMHPWIASGSTLYNPHAIYYSTHGSFYEWAPPDTGWRQPFFVHNKVLADYVSRLCYILTRGRHVADVAILHPASTIHAYSGFGPNQPAAARAAEVYWAVQNSLRKERLDYIILDEDSLARATVMLPKRGGTLPVLNVGKARLKAVVLPGTRVLTAASVNKLREFERAGGFVIIAGDAPDAVADAQTDPAAMREIREKSIDLADPPSLGSLVIEKLGRDLVQAYPFIHRTAVAGRDFYFVLSDVAAQCTFNAEYDINKRRLWEMPAGRGERLRVEVSADGIPELWDAVTGKVRPIHSYTREHGRTQVEVPLADTPAPLISIRRARPDEPSAISANFELATWKREGDTMTATGLPWADAEPIPAQYRARIEFGEKAYQGVATPEPLERIDIRGPLPCRLQPTFDNKDGDFRWPPSKGPLPVEVRSFKYKEDVASAAAADLDDREWETVIASYGPRAMWTRIEAPDLDHAAPPADLSRLDLRPAEYSLSLGINEDPIYPSALGGKGRVPEEFIDISPAQPGHVFYVTAQVTAPAQGGGDAVPALLRIGGEARKRAFLNGQEIKFEMDPAARILRAPVSLKTGANRLELLASRPTYGRLRLFYQLLPATGVDPDPQWIWSRGPSPTGKTIFMRIIDVPSEIKSASMVVALGTVYQIRMNGQLLADQGNFEPYFMGRSEHYDLTRFMKTDANVLEITVADSGPAVGMLLDGLVETKDGKRVPFVSDASFVARAAIPDDKPSGVKAMPARILAGPANGYLGETATLLLYPRRHPLPHGGWLLDQKPLTDSVFGSLVYSTGRKPAPSAWYRFLVPPGATSMRMKAYGLKEVYLNGQALSVPISKASRGDASAVEVRLPEPQSPRRVAAVLIEPQPGSERGAAFAEPVTFDVGPGRIPLGSWDELGLPHYSGGMLYLTELEIDAADQGAKRKVFLDLGHVRGTVDVTVNSKPCGTRLWHPYRFNITDAVQAGKNYLDIRVFNTLGPHFGVGHPSAHVFEGQMKSGIYGPIRVDVVSPVVLKLGLVK